MSKKYKPKYSAEEKDRAFRLWVELRSLNKVATKLEISYPTVQGWSKKEHWDLRAEQLLAREREDNDLLERNLKSIADDLGLKPADMETYKNLKVVEAKLMHRAKGKSTGDISLDTLDYDKVVTSLKKVWDTKQAIIARVTAPKKEAGAINVGVAINLPDLVAQVSNKKITTVEQKQLN